MRVTDLARKLNLKTEELREKLPSYGVAHDAKEVTADKAATLLEKLKGTGSAPAEDEGPALMGLMFDDEPTGMLIEEESETPAPAVVVEEEVAPPVAKEDEEEEIEIIESVARQFAPRPKPAPMPPRPVAPRPGTAPRPAASTAAPRPAGSGGFNASARTQRSSTDLDAARARWAAAKSASEKILEVKKATPTAAPTAGAGARPDLRRGRGGRPQQPAEPELPRAPKKQKTLVIDKTGDKKKIAIGDMVSVREFAEKAGVSPIFVVTELLKNGVMANLNASIDYDTASIVAEAFWCEVERDVAAVSSEDLLKGNISKLLEDDPAHLSPRAPVVAVMGHVDHGKTTLLDAIRHADVAAGESGGITQHIGAYQVRWNDRNITFLDTPGHEAFTAMRARGARATDIAILVIAADDGMKPQTIEAMNHAKDAGVPIIVAVTKIDKEGANVERIKSQLAEHDLTPADWGGKTEVVPVSGKTKQGIDELLEIILLTNDVEPVMGNPNRPAVGTIIESHLDKSLGPVATVLVNTGTLHVGNDFIIGSVIGRVKRMTNWDGKSVKEAPPGMPVQIAGLGALPNRSMGEILQAFPDAATAKTKADEFARLMEIRDKQKQGGMGVLLGRIKTGKIKELKLVVKSDVEGSLEAIRSSLEKIANPEVKTKIIHGGVGDITETDVLMASASDGLVIGFHVKVPPHVEKIADRDGVTIRRHTIIYKLLEEIEKMLGGMLDPEEIETELGTLDVRGVFYTKGNEQIIGGHVIDGRLEMSANVRIYRGETQIGEGRIVSLKREKDDAREVREGFDCGLRIHAKNLRVEMGDRIVAWKKEMKEKTL